MRTFNGIWLVLALLHTRVIICESSNQAKELSKLLVQFKATGLSSFSTVTIFDCSDYNHQLEISRKLSRAFITSKIHDLDSDQFAWKESIASFSAHQRLLILDLNCPHSESFLLETKSEMMFVAPNKWLLISHECPNTDCVLSKLAGLDKKLLPDSEVLIWLSQSQRLISVYKVSTESGRDWQIEDRTPYLHNHTLLLQDNSAITSRRRSDLQMAYLKSSIVIVNYDSLNNLNDYPIREIDSFSKTSYVWAKFLASMLNATVRFKLETSWGYPRGNGSWGGMTGMMQRGEIEFGASHMYLNRERLKVVHYLSGLTMRSRSRFIFRRPALSSVANLFALPFRPSVWLAVLALALLLGFLLYPAMLHEWRRHRDTMTKPHLGDETLIVIGALAQQGFWYEARAASTRVLVLVGLLGFMSLHAAYAANIVALLQSTSSSIKSLKDLLASPLDLGAQDTVFFRYYFKSTGKLEPKVRGAIAEKCEWLDLDEGVRRLRGGHFVLHAVAGMTYRLVHESFEEDEKCDFEEINFLNMFEPHMAVAKFSPYKEMFRVKALRIRETGMRTREISKLYSRRPRCDAAASSRRFISVGFAECRGAFYALGYGLLAAAGMLVAEMVYRYLPVSKCRNQLKQLYNRELVAEIH